MQKKISQKKNLEKNAWKTIAHTARALRPLFFISACSKSEILPSSQPYQQRIQLLHSRSWNQDFYLRKTAEQICLYNNDNVRCKPEDCVVKVFLREGPRTLRLSDSQTVPTEGLKAPSRCSCHAYRDSENNKNIAPAGNQTITQRKPLGGHYWLTHAQCPHEAPLSRSACTAWQKKCQSVLQALGLWSQSVPTGGSSNSHSVPTGGLKAALRFSSGKSSASSLRFAFKKSLGRLHRPF